MASKKAPKYGARDVFAALEKKFAAPAWALLAEVGDKTGFGCTRHADAVAVSLWPSRGLGIHGIEIKVSRQDWQRELMNPDKADAIQKFCDFWWVAVGDESIIEPGELPPTWGLMVLGGQTLKTKREAPALKPKPLDKGFVAALLRRAAEGLDARVTTARSDGLAEGRGLGPPELERKIKDLENENKNLETAIKEFEEKSGIKIGKWNAGRIGAAVEKIMMLSRYNHEHFDPIVEVEQAERVLRERADNLARAAEELRAARKAADGAARIVQVAQELGRKAG